MRKMELTEKSLHRREVQGCCSLQQAGKEEVGGNWGRDQMQMEDEESRPSGGDGAAKPVVLAQYSGPSAATGLDSIITFA